MKKILKYILLGCGIFLITQKITNASSEFKLEQDPNHLTYFIQKGSHKFQLYFYLIKDVKTEELIYCLEPGVALSNEIYEELSEWEYAKLNLTEEQKDFITKVAYFGYGYQNHTNLNYYYASQLLIWEKIIPTDWKIYYTNRLGGEEQLLATAEREEILKLIEQDNQVPSFQNQTISWNYIDTLELEDTNHVLKGYKITSANGLEISQKDYTLQIKSQTPQSHVIELEKQYEGEALKFYYRENGQNVMRRGSLIPKKIQVVLNPQERKVEIIKTDEWNNPLANAEFELVANQDINSQTGNKIYQKGQIIQKQKTDSNGKLIFHNLWDGEYCLKETEAPIGYQKKDEPLCFTISEQEISKSFTIQNEKKKQTLILKKEDEKDNHPLANVRFQIRNEKGECIFDGKTNELGIIELSNLLIGKYQIQEIETIEGYMLDSEIIYFELDGNSEEIIITLTNQKLENVPNTIENQIIFFEYLYLGAIVLYQWQKQLKL